MRAKNNPKSIRAQFNEVKNNMSVVYSSPEIIEKKRDKRQYGMDWVLEEARQLYFEAKLEDKRSAARILRMIGQFTFLVEQRDEEKGNNGKSSLECFNDDVHDRINKLLQSE